MAENINNDNEVYNYLCQNYDTVRIEGDRYYFENGREYGYIPISYETGDNINVYAFMPGDSGGRSDYVLDYARTHSEEFADCAVFVAKVHTTQVNGNDIVSSASNFASSNNMNIANLGGESFSGSGGRMADALAAFVLDPNNQDTNVSMLWTDAYLCSGYDIHYDSYKTLGEHGVVLYGVTDVNTHAVLDGFKTAARNGEEVIYIRTNNPSHGGKVEESLENNMMLYIMGLTDEVGSHYNYSGVQDSEYYVRGYNEETNAFDIKKSLDDIHGDAVYVFKIPEIINVKDLFRVDDFEIKEYPVECLSKYEALKNIETGLSINFGTLSDTVLSSDMIYVTSAMSSLRTQIKNSNFLNGKTLGFRSSTGIPGCITGYINAYYDIMGQLMDSLVRQTESVMSVGQAIVDMNIAMEKKAEELEEAPGVIEEVGAPPTLISEEEEKEEEPPVKETPNTPPIVNPPKEDPVVPPVKETPNTPPIIPPIKEEPEPVSPPVKETPEPEPTEEPVPTKEPEVTQEPTPSEEEAILPELVVGEREDGSKILIEIREGKVTEVKYTYEYGSIEEAESALESIKEKYKELEYIKEIKVNNTNIDIIFKEESYIDLDMDSILNKYFN